LPYFWSFQLSAAEFGGHIHFSCSPAEVMIALVLSLETQFIIVICLLDLTFIAVHFVVSAIIQNWIFLVVKLWSLCRRYLSFARPFTFICLVMLG